MGRPTRRRWLIGLGVLALTLAVVVPGAWLWDRWVGARSFNGPMPEPNGYDDLTAAGRMILGQLPLANQYPKNPGEATAEELQSWLAANGPALGRTRLGLGRESLVRLPGELLPQSRLDDFTALRSVARLLAAEAELAAREGRQGDAARAGLDTLRLGHATYHGGIILDRQVGLAVEMVALPGFDRAVGSLSLDDCRTLLPRLQALDRSREPIDRVIERDKAFTAARGDWRTQMILRFHPATVSAMLKPQEDSLRLLDRRNVAKLRILATNLALRAYRLDHPDAPLPPNVDAVVPAYLAEVPADPFGKGPLRMKVGGGAAVVYSVGPDGIDDGGPAMAIPLRGQFTKATRGDITLGPWESNQELKAGGRPSGRP